MKYVKNKHIPGLVIAVIGLGAIAQVGYLARSYIDRPAVQTPQIGTPVEPITGDDSLRKRRIVLELQTGCHFCNESAPFYRRLLEHVKDKNIDIVAVFPEPREESLAHLASLGLGAIQVRQAPVAVFEVSGTPTLILTNEKGQITRYWIGKLTPEKEVEVLEQLSS